MASEIFLSVFKSLKFILEKIVCLKWAAKAFSAIKILPPKNYFLAPPPSTLRYGTPLVPDSRSRLPVPKFKTTPYSLPGPEVPVGPKFFTGPVLWSRSGTPVPLHVISYLIEFSKIFEKLENRKIFKKFDLLFWPKLKMHFFLIKTLFLFTKHINKLCL